MIEKDRLPQSQKSDKCLKARNSLPDDLRLVYDQLVEDYMFFALTRYGRGWVAYDVIADLVKLGWKRSGSNCSMSWQAEV